MAVSTVAAQPAGEWRTKAVSRAQWWKIAHLALELANVDAPADRGEASDLIVRLDAASSAERAKDDCPFEVAA
jgi:hypothetical protein